MNPDYNQNKYLNSFINDAFDKVTLGRGVSLHETIVIDNHGSPEERKLARKNDEKDDWKNLIYDLELKNIYSIGGLSFYDAEGLRFHLPAYLYLLIEEPEAEICQSIMFTLTSIDDYNLERFLLLTLKQRNCIKQILKYIRHNTGDTFEFDHKNIDQALEKY